MRKPSLIVLYLPQFHSIPENDRWWGKGYTEWTAVKGAKPLFEGHKQPVVPLGKRYYDLMDKETMQWQAELARKYGVGGFAFYHYWFKDGRRVLEKPAENLLRWKDIDMPFCFNWANGTWARTWSAISSASPWADQYETDEQEDASGILLEQKYGDKAAWEQHIAYLLPFFQDKRYIRVDGRPVFVIYHPETVYCISDMIAYWNTYLQNYGEKGIYWIAGVHDVAVPYSGIKTDFDAFYMTSPAPDWRHLDSVMQNGVRCYDAREYWRAFFARHAPATIGKKPLYASIVNGYDDTPRRGRAGHILPKLSLEDFQSVLRKAVRMAAKEEQPFLFYNAWNEWGEGMFLEPDEAQGYAYLEAVRDVMEEEIPEEKGAAPSVLDPRLSSISRDAVRYAEEANILARWMELREAGRNVGDYLATQGIRTVAIYGYGELGIRLKQELKDSPVEVAYIIDRSTAARDVDCPTYQLRENLPPVDRIIVTVHGLYPEIRADIKRFMTYPVRSLAHILFEM